MKRPSALRLRSPGLLRGTLRLFAAGCALALLGGCAAAKGVHETTPEASIEWPVGQEGARVVWVKNIGDFRELGLGKGFWGRALDLLTGGGNDRSIVRPYGVLHDPSGRLYIADSGAGVVHCLDIGNGRYATIGAEPGSPLRTPIGLAEDDRQRLYITDSRSGMVFRYDESDKVLRPFLTIPLKRPTGIAYNPVDKLIYVSDTLAGQIVAVDQNGMEKRRINCDFNHPTDLAVDRTGEILVTDSLNFRITVLTPEGQVARQFGAVGDAPGYFSRPKGLAVDSAGHVYVCDSLRDAVQVFGSDGSSLLVFGKGGDGRGRFWMPSGLYIDRSDYIFVADTYNKRIQVFRYLPGQDASN